MTLWNVLGLVRKGFSDILHNVDWNQKHGAFILALFACGRFPFDPFLVVVTFFMNQCQVWWIFHQNIFNAAKFIKENQSCYLSEIPVFLTI